MAMNFSTTTIANELPKQIALLFLQKFEEAQKQMAHIMWNLAIDTLTRHWLLIGGLFVLALVFFFLLALIGEWGSLYSLTYWTLCVVVVFVVGLIWGPEVFVSDIYHLLYLAAIWPICYWVTGWIWNRFNFRNTR